jgi:hypothetical protein
VSDFAASGFCDLTWLPRTGAGIAALLWRKISLECANEFPETLFRRKNRTARQIAAMAMPHSARRAAGEVDTSGVLAGETGGAVTGGLFVGIFCVNEDGVSEEATGGIGDDLTGGLGATQA